MQGAEEVRLDSRSHINGLFDRDGLPWTSKIQWGLLSVLGGRNLHCVRSSGGYLFGPLAYVQATLEDFLDPLRSVIRSLRFRRSFPFSRARPTVDV